MSTTVYGTAQYDDSEGYYTRVGCTYDITSTDDSKIFSGTLFWQHKGPAKTANPYLTTTVRASLSDDSVVMGQTIVGTNGVSTIAKHTNWTTIESKSFSVTYDCLTSARQIKVTGSVFEWFSGNQLEILIDVPPLPSWDVIYDGNGGINAPSAQTKYKNIDLILSSSKPSRADYVFYHWNTQPNNSGTTYNSGDTYTANAALDLYAIWNSKISYNGNGTYISTYPDFPTQTKTYGTNLTLHSATPTRAGYVFNGWNTAADGSGTAFQPGGTYSAEVSVTLYAQWLSLPAKPVISSMTAIRWNETTDAQDDTGTSAKITAEWSIDTTSGYYGNTNTGTVTLTVTPQSGSSSHTITPVSGTSGASGTAIFMVSGLDTDMQYNCTITVTDLNSSSNRTVILTRAFFIMDFKAGGQGIGIGRAAPDSGLEIGYNVTCDQDLRVYENETIDGNLTIEGITTHTGRISANGNIFANARMRVQKDMLAMGAELRGDMRASGYGGVSVGTSASLDDLYIAVTDETKPAWVYGEFYSRVYNSTIGTISYTRLTSEPSDWNTAWTNYYRRKGENGLFKCAYDTEFEDKATSTIEDILRDATISPIVDYIVEQGTSGIWSYRKWNSGAAEWWGVYSANAAFNSNSSALGGFRATVTGINFPFTSTQIPTITATHTGSSSNYYCAVVNIEASQTGCNITLDRANAVSSGGIKLSIKAIGRWK